jgi:hypothetical protein
MKSLSAEEIEYIKELIAQLESDKKYNLLFTTFNLAIVSLTVNACIFASQPIIFSLVEKYLLSIGLIALIIGSIGLSLWFVKLHVLRIETTDLFNTKEITKARKKHNGEFYKKNSFWHKIGYIFSDIGYGFFIIEILIRLWN